MTKFRHLILTRFNVLIPEYRDSAGAGWLEHRFDLFERFCLPCVRSQTSQNFDWLLFSRPDMPAGFRARLDAYSGWRNIRIVYLEGDFTQAAVRAAVAELARGVSHLITTRLDNDDGICRTFVENIQARFTGQNLEFLNFTHGYILANGQAYTGRHMTNAFISLVENADRPRTVYSGNHMRLHEQGPIRQIETPPGWLQVIHSRNLVNEAWGKPASFEDLYSYFDIQPERPSPTKKS
ncbi:MAG TPA: glycosyltransferase [Verrucomicrobiae bacterium]|nr:glycosyltransferase [Verrucomicrobiae bacterium]